MSAVIGLGRCIGPRVASITNACSTVVVCIVDAPVLTGISTIIKAVATANHLYVALGLLAI